MVLFAVSKDEVKRLEPVSFQSRYNEDRIQNLADENPHLINDGIPMLSLGCEIATQHGHYIDNLFLDTNGTLVVAEMKRGQAPRDVVAQVLDYAAFADRLNWDDLEPYCRNRHGASIDPTFQKLFGKPLRRGEGIDHRLLVVAESYDPKLLDAATYLINRGTALTLFQFRLFEVGDGEVLEVFSVLGEIPEQRDDHFGSVAVSTGDMPGEGYANWLFGSIAEALPDIAQSQSWEVECRINKQSLPFASTNWPLAFGDCQLRLDIYKRGRLSFRLSVNKRHAPGIEKYLEDRRDEWISDFPAELEKPSSESPYVTLSLEVPLPEIGDQAALRRTVEMLHAMTRSLIPLIDGFFAEN